MNLLDAYALALFDLERARRCHGGYDVVRRAREARARRVLDRARRELFDAVPALETLATLDDGRPYRYHRRAVIEPGELPRVSERPSPTEAPTD